LFLSQLPESITIVQLRNELVIYDHRTGKTVLPENLKLSHEFINGYLHVMAILFYVKHKVSFGKNLPDLQNGLNPIFYVQLMELISFLVV